MNYPTLPNDLKPTLVYIEESYYVLQVRDGNYVSIFKWDGFRESYNYYVGTYIIPQPVEPQS